MHTQYDYDRGRGERGEASRRLEPVEGEAGSEEVKREV
jgi:hypothetical protein